MLSVKHPTSVSGLRKQESIVTAGGFIEVEVTKHFFTELNRTPECDSQLACNAEDQTHEPGSIVISPYWPKAACDCGITMSFEMTEAVII